MQAFFSPSQAPFGGWGRVNEDICNFIIYGRKLMSFASLTVCAGINIHFNYRSIYWRLLCKRDGVAAKNECGRTVCWMVINSYTYIYILYETEYINNFFGGNSKQIPLFIRHNIAGTIWAKIISELAQIRHSKQYIVQAAPHSQISHLTLNHNLQQLWQIFDNCCPW